MATAWKNTEDLFCPAPQVVRDFCLEENFPAFLFRYKKVRQPPAEDELHLCSFVHVLTPNDFIVQLDPDRRTSDLISYELGKIYETREENVKYSLSDQLLHVGIPVAARFMQAEDLRWYRAIITRIDKRPGAKAPIQVQFIDYGNFQQNERHHLKMMPSVFGNEPPLGIRCRVKGTQVNDRFPSEVATHFRTWTKVSTKDNHVLITFIKFDQAAEQQVVRLYDSADGEEYIIPAVEALVEKPPSPPPQSVTKEIASMDYLIQLDEDPADQNKKKHENGVNATSERVSLMDMFNEEIPAAISVEQPRESASPLDDWNGMYNCVAPVLTPIVQNNHDTLVDMGDTAGANGTTHEEKEVQTDTNDSESNGQSAGDGQYDIFADPHYQILVDKFPRLIKYLKFPPTK